MMNATRLATCTGSDPQKVRNLLPQIVSVMRAYEINTPERQAAFLALVLDADGAIVNLQGRVNLVNLTVRLRAKFSDLAVPDFSADPGKLLVPVWAARAAADLWAQKSLNRAADVGDMNRCHREIKGAAAKGLAERVSLCERGKRELMEHKRA